MAKKKRHDQYCPIARTVDLLGDRWTLLILRELLLGDRRFVDLREWLPGISPTLLIQRLQELTANGLIATIELPPPPPEPSTRPPQRDEKSVRSFVR
jgi:DNA-binding HxlR family transcriptional regulator